MLPMSSAPLGANVKSYCQVIFDNSPGDTQIMLEYFPVFLLLLAAAALGGTMWLVASIFGPNHSNAVKEAPFECGNPSFGTQGKRFSVKFYIVAMLFLVFDLEVVFLYPWAVLFRQLGWFGFLEMLVFLMVLVIGLAYEWRKGALQWD
jgi:NADH-quinone oxidoreductase subunit A